VRREVLLEAVRDEQGNLFLSITKTRIICNDIINCVYLDL